MALSFRKIRTRIEQEIVDNWDTATYPVQFENTEFDGTNVQIYLAPRLLYTSAGRVEIGVGGTTTIVGLISCDVVGTKGQAMQGIEDVIDSFCEMFNEKQFDIEAGKYIYFDNPSVASKNEVENRVILTVIIPFRSMQKGA